MSDVRHDGPVYVCMVRCPLNTSLHVVAKNVFLMRIKIDALSNFQIRDAARLSPVPGSHHELVWFDASRISRPPPTAPPSLLCIRELGGTWGWGGGCGREPRGVGRCAEGRSGAARITTLRTPCVRLRRLHRPVPELCASWPRALVAVGARPGSGDHRALRPRRTRLCGFGWKDV